MSRMNQLKHIFRVATSPENLGDEPKSKESHLKFSSLGQAVSGLLLCNLDSRNRAAWRMFNLANSTQKNPPALNNGIFRVGGMSQ